MYYYYPSVYAAPHVGGSDVLNILVLANSRNTLSSSAPPLSSHAPGCSWMSCRMWSLPSPTLPCPCMCTPEGPPRGSPQSAEGSSSCTSDAGSVPLLPHTSTAGAGCTAPSCCKFWGGTGWVRFRVEGFGEGGGGGQRRQKDEQAVVNGRRRRGGAISQETGLESTVLSTHSILPCCVQLHRHRIKDAVTLRCVVSALTLTVQCLP